MTYPNRNSYRRSLALVAVALMTFALGSASVRAEEAPEAELPVQAFGDPAHDLPLALFKEISEAMTAAQGGASGQGDAKSTLNGLATKHEATLLKALNAAQVIHREMAVRILGFAEPKEATLTALGKTLKAEPDAAVRRSAAGALTEMNDAAGVEAMIAGLEDKDETVRVILASGLGKIRDDRATKPLLRVLREDGKPSVRMRAAAALKTIQDKETLKEMLTAMDAEQDYRVKMAIASAVRAIRGQDLPHTANVPTEKQQKGALTQLSGEMKDVEDKLRADRHDQAVQVQQTEIDKNLTAMIKQLEKMKSQGQGQGKGKKKQQSQQQPKPGGGKPGNKSGQPSSPLADSNLGGSASRGALREGEVTGHQSEWATLPPAMRDEMLQVYRGKVPERWRNRLKAYFLSVAAEEAKEAGR